MGIAEELALRVTRAPAPAGSTRVIAVDGPSGAGKTTFAEKLGLALAGAAGPPPVIHLDDLYPGWDGLDDVVPRLMEWVILPLTEGRDPRYRRYDWPSGRYAEWHDVVLPTAPADRVLVIEGVGAGSRQPAPYLSLLVWVQAPADLRMSRGIERDGEAYRPHWERWARQEQALFEREGTADRADVVIDGTGLGES